MVTCKGIVRKNSDMSASFELTQMWQQAEKQVLLCTVAAFSVRASITVAEHRFKAIRIRSRISKDNNATQRNLKLN